ncbi:3-hydroxybutyryl-CoA dehydrogenase [Cerasibacillus terrae]|uniref:3-hydroxybutyryl-CoA dehydrogenase n=1 Tax=Cerasibacillus terrae TaxID=2498845 RepID=A0A5C8NV06_9BACI|nr:3-hydroxyacyl-CoA dehydrogenase NAD-binding domain-containing protein [Cerasibacillus terrae]TXL64920.1 3-hydroxybutyryl-CoA dehydrogenase [Cerasibacillus terrae]
MKIGVVGSGIMGNGIAQVFAMSGHTVILSDLNKQALDKAELVINQNVERVLKKSNQLDKKQTVLDCLTYTTDNSLLKDADLIVEAVTENMEVKRSVFKELDSFCTSKTILATNTSGLSITELANMTNRPGKVCGMHFFNPVPVMKLVEIVRGAETTDETIQFVQSLTKEMEKVSIVAKDSPLFVVNRILIPMLSEAMFVYGEGIASAEDIDSGMVYGTNQPIGPLRLADMIGLDTLLYVQETLLEETGDSKYRIPPILKQLVRAGHYGRKTNKGFYTYE